MYKNEANFSRAFLTSMKKHRGMFIQRLESGLTGRGIPDLFVASNKTARWIELKNKPYDNIWDTKWTVPWRQGQQAWMSKYYRITGRACFTIMAVKNGFVWIPMYTVYPNNVVSHDDNGVQCGTAIDDMITLLREVL